MARRRLSRMNSCWNKDNSFILLELKWSFSLFEEPTVYTIFFGIVFIICRGYSKQMNWSILRCSYHNLILKIYPLLNSSLSRRLLEQTLTLFKWKRIRICKEGLYVFQKYEIKTQLCVILFCLSINIKIRIPLIAKLFPNHHFPLWRQVWSINWILTT